MQEINNLKKFSAYDVTKNLRNKVNNNTLLIEDVKLVSGGGKKPNYLDIVHEEVNDIIKDIYTNHIIIGLNRTQGSGYHIYELIPSTQTFTTNTISFKKDLKNIISPSQNTTKVLNGFSKSERHKIYTKVASYVFTKRKNKEDITLKSINSVLKIKGITVKDVKDICNKLGYKVVTKTPTYASEVK